ncbi:hypothetical protein FGG79_00065 [Bacillus sp. BHET2]|uniref:hypothetical protein n=1 Tax=Bacillus sp. BHET2 TaxID=2583818 RepID=UPI00110DABAF|nr:hypothetical protein [Bacillus sp. BHET2]TMU86583.1 hypothetical protein FGG79_00065 [Bacillus sp. BHET2]
MAQPRRKASTRNRSESVPQRPSIGPRVSTRSKDNAIRTTTDSPAVRPSTRPQNSTSSRTEVYGERREAKKLTAPIQFVLVMFIVVVVSVFAFGLLRGDPTAQRPDRPDQERGAGTEVFYEKEGTTSTNTGILRGH